MHQDSDLFARQLARELGQHQEAQQRLAKSTREAEDKSYASSTVYGQKTLKTFTLPIAERMSQRLKALGRGNGAVDGATVYNHLKAAKPEHLALLALKVCLDELGKAEKHPTFVQLCTAIGAAIEVELRLQWYVKENRDLYNDVKRGFHKSTGTRQKVTVFKLRFNDAGHEWPTWSSPVKQKIGAWCFEAISTATGWLEVVTETTKRKRQNYVIFTNQFIGMRDSIMNRASELAYCLWPMLCSPCDWEATGGGGFLTEEVRSRNPLVRGDFDGLTVQEGLPLDFINNLQHQKYKLNERVMEVADWAFDRMMTIGKMSREEPLPTDDGYPHGDPKEDPERFLKWKGEQRRIRNYNAQLSQKNWRTTETMFVARKYKGEDQFYLPWSFCYRGRVYPQSIGLSVQGTDFDKSLFYFAEDGPVNEYWLAWHVATTYGHDKWGHDARVQWTRENIDLIRQIAEDPYGTVSLWENLDENSKPNGEPWCFLAAALEYYDCVINPTKQTSGLPIGVDATCSGLQHLSLMTLDEEAALEVNVKGRNPDKPADGYATVAEEAKKHLPEELHPYLKRGTTKRCVMTTPYGVSRDSARKYIRKALKELGLDLSIPGRLGSITDAIYKEAVPTIFSGPVAVMNWLQGQVSGLLEKRDHITWKTPSGFNVRQDIRYSNVVRIRTKVMGSTVASSIGDGYLGPDEQSHVGAIAPNLVHSYDASLLHLTFAYWDKPFTVIHDCALARSCDMDQLNHDIRLHTAEMYKARPLEEWADQQDLELPEGMIVGNLNPDDVLNSPFYFC